MEKKNNPSVDIEMMPKVNEIMASDATETDKLAEAFTYLLGQYIGFGVREKELQKSLGDQQALLKAQIQHNTLEFALSMFKDCYHRATGRSVPNG